MQAKRLSSANQRPSSASTLHSAQATPAIGSALQARLQRPKSAASLRHFAHVHVHTDGSLRTLPERAERVEVSSLLDEESSTAPRLLAYAHKQAQQRPRPHPSPIAEQAARGPLAVKLPAPPLPPPTEVPEEYHVYDLIDERKVLSLGDRSRYRIFPSTRPSNRSEVQHLGRALEQMLLRAGANSAEALRAWDVVFAELVRQVFVGCGERGELLGRVRRAYSHYLACLMERVRTMEVRQSGRNA